MGLELERLSIHDLVTKMSCNFITVGFVSVIMIQNIASSKVWFLVCGALLHDRKLATEDVFGNAIRPLTNNVAIYFSDRKYVMSVCLETKAKAAKHMPAACDANRSPISWEVGLCGWRLGELDWLNKATCDNRSRCLIQTYSGKHT